MSTQTVNDFWLKARQEPALEQKLRAIPLGDAGTVAAAMVRIADEAGFRLTTDDFETALKEDIAHQFAAGELNEEQLAAVSGGALSYTGSTSCPTCMR
jgi:predicted ribosomally synthesized peptide with nif11-like leader